MTFHIRTFVNLMMNLYAEKLDHCIVLCFSNEERQKTQPELSSSFQHLPLLQLKQSTCRLLPPGSLSSLFLRGKGSFYCNVTVLQSRGHRSLIHGGTECNHTAFSQSGYRWPNDLQHYSDCSGSSEVKTPLNT